MSKKFLGLKIYASPLISQRFLNRSPRISPLLAPTVALSKNFPIFNFPTVTPSKTD